MLLVVYCKQDKNNIRQNNYKHRHPSTFPLKHTNKHTHAHTHPYPRHTHTLPPTHKLPHTHSHSPMSQCSMRDPRPCEVKDDDNSNLSLNVV